MWNRLISTPFLMDVYCLFIVTYLTSSKLNNIDNQTLYYTMVQIW